jgi:hypothetical protein
MEEHVAKLQQQIIRMEKILDGMGKPQRKRVKVTSSDSDDTIEISDPKTNQNRKKSIHEAVRACWRNDKAKFAHISVGIIFEEDAVRRIVKATILYMQQQLLDSTKPLDLNFGFIADDLVHELTALEGTETKQSSKVLRNELRDID